MKRIVAITHPFDRYQAVYLYDNNNQVGVSTVETAGVCDYICKMLEDTDITSINLLGARQYNKGLMKKIEKIINNTYSHREININIL